jgi:hypothetical protein
MAGRRPRTERRARERELRKQVRERERIAELAPGGAPERPIVVATAAVVEPRASSSRCHQCGGELELTDHTAEQRDGVNLRVAHTKCRRCHVAGRLWFRIDPPRPS